MKVSAARENILKKIRKALSQSTPLPFPQSEGNSSVFKPPSDSLDVIFAEEFIKLQGKFVFCSDAADLKNQLTHLGQKMNWEKIYFKTGSKELTDLLAKSWMELNVTDDLAACDASITLCECLVARTGSIVMSARQSGGRTTSVYAPVHICIAYTKQLVYDIKDALQLLRDKYGNNLPSLVSFATGPSRTADIEKTLVVGVHGPRQVYVFLLDEPMAD